MNFTTLERMVSNVTYYMLYIIYVMLYTIYYTYILSLHMTVLQILKLYQNKLQKGTDFDN